MLCLALALAACAAEEAPPALAVGDVAYAELELGVLSETQRHRLADLTAFGLAVANGELARLGVPFIERERQSLTLQKLAAEIAAREAGVDEAALRLAYEKAPEYELIVRHVVILAERWRPEAERARARERAEAALRRVRAGEAFARVAAELSEEPGAAERGGLLHPGRRGSWVPAFWAAASRLAVGEVSGVVETEYGFHVLKLEERRALPLEEVRDQAIGRLVDLAAAAGRAEEWAVHEAAVLHVDRAAVADWRAGTAADSTVLASWPGGAYRAGSFRRYLLTLDAEAAARLSSAGEAAYVAVVGAAARSALLLTRAETMGIELSSVEIAAAGDRWGERAQGWATTLGFRVGMEPEAVKQAALAALSSSQQSVQIARGEVVALSAALRALYPVVAAARGGTS